MNFVQWRGRRVDLYGPDGWVNMGEILDTINVPFLIMIGARGIGKTYGLFDQMTRRNANFVYLRLMNDQAKYSVTEGISDLLHYYVDHEMEYDVEKTAKNVWKVTREGSDSAVLVSSLYAIGTVRGINADSFDYIFLDEFIAEAGHRVNKDVDLMLYNAYESLNRNRELSGRPPMRLIMATNSNQINSALLAGMNLIDPLVKARRKGQSLIDLKERGVAILDFSHSPISQRKADTALYRAATSDEFRGMALDNQFADYSDEFVKSYNLKNYVPVWTYEYTMTGYRPKTDGPYYISAHTSGSPNLLTRHTPNKQELLRGFWFQRIRNNLYFENYNVKTIFENIFTNKLQ